MTLQEKNDLAGTAPGAPHNTVLGAPKTVKNPFS